MQVDLGPADDVPTDRAVAVADGRAVAVRVGSEVRVFANRCLHQASPLAGALVQRGTLSCPLHFWRYTLPEGRHVGGSGCLETFPTHVIAGRVVVEVPDPAPARSVREQLLAHARSWERDGRGPR
jgi:nitrite reductase (NADH) small subunit